MLKVREFHGDLILEDARTLELGDPYLYINHGFVTTDVWLKDADVITLRQIARIATELADRLDAKLSNIRE